MTGGSRPLRRVVLLDTSVASTNLGDAIIMEAVRAELAPLLEGALVTTVASHERLGPKGRALLRAADLVIAGGTNLIGSHMGLRSVWRLVPRDAFLDMRVVLMGVGWYQFQRPPDLYTRWLLQRVLHRTALHSVRDGYTAQKLAQLGVRASVNTGCPTLWRLTPEGTAAIPVQRGTAVVTTVNTYMPDRAADQAMIDVLRARYRTLYGWAQTAEDHAYLKALAPEAILVPPSLEAFDALLASTPGLDYVGNRLHGGIRALQHGRRAIIIEIDNRAAEMGRDFHLPTVVRHDAAALAARIDAVTPIRVTPPVAAIATWKRAVQELLWPQVN